MYFAKKSQVGLLAAVVLGLMAIRYVPAPTLHLAVIWLTALYACLIVRFDLIHPYCWFSLTFALYNTAYTILYVCGYDQTAGYSSGNAVYTLSAMAVVWMIVTPRRINKGFRFEKENVTNTVLVDWAFYLLAFLCAAFALILQSKGYSGKKEMQAANDIFYSLGVHLVRWMIVLLLVRMCEYRCRDWKKNIKYLGISVAAAVLLGLLTGERDMIFRAGLVYVFLLFYFDKIKKIYLAFLVPAGVLLMNASVYFKYFFLSGVVNTRHKETGGILYQFLMTDFYATGRNTQYLLNAAWTKGYFGIKLFLSELFRGLVPFVAFVNPSAWYNNDVFPGSFKGQAFSLVGFGHAIGGFFGVLLVSAALGLFIRVTYRMHRHSLYFLVFYLYSISIVMGCYRQTLNTVVNMSIKGALIGILISEVITWVSIRRRMRQIP